MVLSLRRSKGGMDAAARRWNPAAPHAVLAVPMRLLLVEDNEDLADAIVRRMRRSDRTMTACGP